MDRGTAAPHIQTQSSASNAGRWAAFRQRHASRLMGSEKSVWDRSRPALQRGLLPVGCGFGSSRPLPPLNATRQEIDVALQIPEDVLNEVIS